jgi:hypothetical protein
VLDVCHPLAVRGVGVFSFGRLLLSTVATPCTATTATTATSCAATAAATGAATT